MIPQPPSIPPSLPFVPPLACPIFHSSHLYTQPYTTLHPSSSSSSSCCLIGYDRGMTLGDIADRGDIDSEGSDSDESNEVIVILTSSNNVQSIHSCTLTTVYMRLHHFSVYDRFLISSSRSMFCIQDIFHA
jgi:hypothetical protein